MIVTAATTGLPQHDSRPSFLLPLYLHTFFPFSNIGTKN